MNNKIFMKDGFFLMITIHKNYNLNNVFMLQNLLKYLMEEYFF